MEIVGMIAILILFYAAYMYFLVILPQHKERELKDLFKYYWEHSYTFKKEIERRNLYTDRHGDEIRKIINELSNDKDIKKEIQESIENKRKINYLIEENKNYTFNNIDRIL